MIRQAGSTGRVALAFRQCSLVKRACTLPQRASLSESHSRESFGEAPASSSLWMDRRAANVTSIGLVRGSTGKMPVPPGVL